MKPNNYKRFWEIVVDKLDPEPWRYEFAKRGEYREALFAYKESDNPDASDSHKGKVEWDWEKRVWKAIYPNWSYDGKTGRITI